MHDCGGGGGGGGRKQTKTKKNKKNVKNKNKNKQKKTKKQKKKNSKTHTSIVCREEARCWGAGEGEVRAYTLHSCLYNCIGAGVAIKSPLFFARPQT